MPGPRRISGWMAGAALGVALLGLTLGWGAGVDVFVRAAPTLPAMVPASAMLLAILAVAQLTSLTEHRMARATGVALLVVAIPLVFALSTVGPVWLNPSAADQVSLSTVLGVSTVALAQIIARLPNGLPNGTHSTVALVGVFLSATALTGYLFDREALIVQAPFVGLSIPTSSCLLLLSLAVIFGRPEGTFVRLLFHDSAGGRTSRRFLPWAVMIPLWLGFFSSLATDAGLLEERVRLDLFAVAMVMVACALVIGAGWTQVLQQERENLAKRRLRGVVAGLETAVFLGRSREDMTAMNPRAERMLRADGGAPTLAGVAFHALQDRAVLTGPDHPLMRAVDGGGPVFAGWMDGTGGERVLEFTAHPLDDPALPETVVAVHDVTGPWLLRENLSLADRREAISDIAQGYAHELTNIFGIIKLAAGTSQLNAPDFAVESLRSIESACRRGGYLVDRMQALTREGHAQSQPTDAAEVLSEAVVSARDALGPGVSMVADIPEVALPVACDPVDLEIALKNLVANAEDAIREGGEVDGRIVVRLVPGEQSLALHVRDTGPGIPPEVAAHATEPFFTTRRSRGGVGLGLSIVETLANRLGGTFVIGPAKGRGTEAVLTLPLSAERGAETDDATRPPASRLDGISVLVAEDDREFQSMLADTLRKLGATVTHVANGAEALAHLRDHPETDVLVADYLLEGDMTGHDLAVAARAAGSRARVVYLSGYLERGRKPLPDAPGLMLRKPVSLGLLSNSIRLAARSVPRDQPRS